MKINGDFAVVQKRRLFNCASAFLSTLEKMLIFAFFAVKSSLLDETLFMRNYENKSFSQYTMAAAAELMRLNGPAHIRKAGGQNAQNVD